MTWIFDVFFDASFSDNMEVRCFIFVLFLYRVVVGKVELFNMFDEHVVVELAFRINKKNRLDRESEVPRDIGR
jgi:hypothetical protein